MTEQHPSEPEVTADESPEADLDEAATEAAPTPVAAQHTGHEAVDAVLGSLESLDDLPLEEHPGAFERAHDALRTALSEARERPSGS